VNPFDLAGPQFLVFYAALAAVTLAVLVLHRQGTEAGPAAVLSDPYEIAYLRDGWQEAVSLAIASLIQRDLLCAHPFALAEGVTPEQVTSPLERQVLSRCAQETDPQRLIEDASLRGATEEIRQSLVRQGLLPGPEVELERRSRLWLAQAVLMGTALVKGAVALSRGHTNLVFLLALTVLSAFGAQRLAAPRRTRRGDDTLRHLKALMARLRQPSRERGLAPHEATLVGAVFGLAAVGGSEWVRLAGLHPRVTRADSGSSSWSWSCGSSSSCGSSGGSSCGSGGGCGGCGGCGS
jgi:uncharacterized protein (TIGR04222 family)